MSCSFGSVVFSTISSVETLLVYILYAISLRLAYMPPTVLLCVFAINSISVLFFKESNNNASSASVHFCPMFAGYSEDGSILLCAGILYVLQGGSL